MGVVFEAHQDGLERRVAIKMLLPDALRYSNVVDRFKREARLASSMSHPGLVTIHAFGVEPLPYIVMEYLEGEDLRDHLGRRGLLPLGEALAILAPALAAVGSAHRRGVIHRDLKPENIFLAEVNGARVVKVLDFGIARAVTANWGTMSERLTGTGMACGTPHYMAPEQLRGADDLGPPADVYSLGCLLFELLNGQPPFDGKSPVDIALKHVDKAPPPLLPEYAGTHIEYVVYRALAKNATARFSDANAMLEELRRGIEAPPAAEAREGELFDWSRVTVRVADGQAPPPVGARVELPTDQDLKASTAPPGVFQTEPDTDPSSASAMMPLPAGSSADEEAAPTQLWTPPSSDHTIPLPRLAALPEGETLEEFKRRAGSWAPNTRPHVELSVPSSTPPAPLAATAAPQRAPRPKPQPPAQPAPAPAQAPAPQPAAEVGRWLWIGLGLLALVLVITIGVLITLLLLRVL